MPSPVSILMIRIKASYAICPSLMSRDQQPLAFLLAPLHRKHLSIEQQSTASRLDISMYSVRLYHIVAGSGLEVHCKYSRFGLFNHRRKGGGVWQSLFVFLKAYEIFLFQETSSGSRMVLATTAHISVLQLIQKQYKLLHEESVLNNMSNKYH